MTWLFGQLWFLMFLAFVMGSVAAWLIAKIAVPHVDELESETGIRTEGIV
jgi:phosphoenolpyruvate carboxylase